MVPSSRKHLSSDQQVREFLYEKFMEPKTGLIPKTFFTITLGAIASAALASLAIGFTLSRLPQKVIYYDSPINLVDMVISYLSKTTIFQISGGIFGGLSLLSLGITFSLFYKNKKQLDAMEKQSKNDRTECGILVTEPLNLLSEAENKKFLSAYKLTDQLTFEEKFSAKCINNLIRINILMISFTLVGIGVCLFSCSKTCTFEFQIHNETLIASLKKYAIFLKMDPNEWSQLLPNPYLGMNHWLSSPLDFSHSPVTSPFLGTLATFYSLNYRGALATLGFAVLFAIFAFAKKEYKFVQISYEKQFINKYFKKFPRNSKQRDELKSKFSSDDIKIVSEQLKQVEKKSLRIHYFYFQKKLPFNPIFPNWPHNILKKLFEQEMMFKMYPIVLPFLQRADALTTIVQEYYGDRNLQDPAIEPKLDHQAESSMSEEPVEVKPEGDS